MRERARRRQTPRQKLSPRTPTHPDASRRAHLVRAGEEASGNSTPFSEQKRLQTSKWKRLQTFKCAPSSTFQVQCAHSYCSASDHRITLCRACHVPTATRQLPRGFFVHLCVLVRSARVGGALRGTELADASRRWRAAWHEIDGRVTSVTRCVADRRDTSVARCVARPPSGHTVRVAYAMQSNRSKT